jgi:hypothetical protein
MSLYPARSIGSWSVNRWGAVLAAAVGACGATIWALAFTTNSSLMGVWIFAWALAPLGPLLVPVCSIISVVIAYIVGNQVAFFVSPVIIGILYGLACYLQLGVLARAMYFLRGTIRRAGERRAVRARSGAES